jgi:hypothetical protein
LHKINANKRLIETANAIVAPIMEAKSRTSESLLSGAVETSYMGLAVAPVVSPVLAH